MVLEKINCPNISQILLKVRNSNWQVLTVLSFFDSFSFLQVMEIEKDRGRQYQSSLFTPSGGDTQKLSSKVKQLSLNLDITKQRKEELERANKQLSGTRARCLKPVKQWQHFPHLYCTCVC